MGPSVIVFWFLVCNLEKFAKPNGHTLYIPVDSAFNVQNWQSASYLRFLQPCKAATLPVLYVKSCFYWNEKGMRIWLGKILQVA